MWNIFELQICLQIQLTTDYIVIDKMSYIFLLKLKNFTFMGYWSKILKFRFSLKWFEENRMIWVAWMRLFLTKNNCVICLGEFSSYTEKATVVKTGKPSLIKYSEQRGDVSLQVYLKTKKNPPGKVLQHASWRREVNILI